MHYFRSASIKAVEIVQSTGMQVVCRLGGFHLLMNFLGAIGSIMAGFGLSEALTHMMTGKAYAKAIRGHFLAESALMVLLMDHFFTDSSDTVDVADLKHVYTDLVTHSIQFNDCSMPGCIQSLHDQLCAYKQELGDKHRTARLWLQYMHYVGIVKQFLCAERTQDWNLHLNAICSMLNLLAAAGHNNYTKSARIYLQLMLDLPNSHPWLNQQLTSGRHAVC